MANFTWGMGGQKITTPEQAKNARKVAEALMNQGKATNWGEGLARVTGAFSANALNNSAAEAESEGAQSAAAALAGIGPGASPDAIISAMSNPWLSQPQASVASALLQNGLEQQDPMYQARLAQLQAEAAGGGDEPTFFGTPIWGVGPDGNPAFGTLNNAGEFQVTDTGEFQVGKDPIKIDAGTEWILLDPVTRQPVGRVPKNNEAAAYETATGTAEGKADAENAALLESVQSKMPGLRSVINDLTDLADTATYTQSGQIMDSVKREFGLPVGQGAIDRSSYIAIVDNQVLPLLKDTFGAAFTVQEGESLRATLGDPNKSPAEKKAILNAFIAQKERDVAGMQRAQGVSPAGGPQVSPNGIEYSF